MGWINGLYSVGRLLAAPLFGWWSEQRTYREAVLVNLLQFVIGLFLAHRTFIPRMAADTRCYITTVQAT